MDVKCLPVRTPSLRRGSLDVWQLVCNLHALCGARDACLTCLHATTPAALDGAALLCALQVDFLKLLYDKLLQLHHQYADTPQGIAFPRPSFKVGREPCAYGITPVNGLPGQYAVHLMCIV